MATATLTATTWIYAASYGPSVGGGEEFEGDGRTRLFLFDEGTGFESRGGMVYLYEYPADLTGSIPVTSATLRVTLYETDGYDSSNPSGNITIRAQVDSLPDLPGTVNEVLSDSFASVAGASINASSVTGTGSTFSVDITSIVNESLNGYLLLIVKPAYSTGWNTMLDIAGPEIDLIYTPDSGIYCPGAVIAASGGSGSFQLFGAS